MGDWYRLTGLFPGKSEGWSDHDASWFQFLLKFWEECIENIRKEIGVEKGRFLIVDGKQIFSDKGD